MMSWCNVIISTCCMCSCQNCISSRTLQQEPPSMPFQKWGIICWIWLTKMAQALETSQRMQRRGRGLLLVWRRELERKLSINRHLPRQSRGVTLEIMVQMDRCQGHRQETGNMTSDICDYENGDTESTKTWYHHVSSWPEQTPQRLPTTWPKCLGRGAPVCSLWPPSPTPYSTSSNSFVPPSLESLTELESGHESPVSSALSLDTD